MSQIKIDFHLCFRVSFIILNCVKKEFYGNGNWSRQKTEELTLQCTYNRFVNIVPFPSLIPFCIALYQT